VSWQWILSNPRIPYGIARGFFRALVLRKNTLRTIDIFPTFNCQARCTMCSIAKFRKREGTELTLADYESIAEQGARMGALAVALCGAEPLLERNICDLIRIFHSRGYFVSLVSNGMALGPDYARDLRRAGLNAIHFGLESLDEAVNDRLRSLPGQCRKVLDSVAMCNAEGLLVGICTVFVPGEADRVAAVLRYCQDNGLRAFLSVLAPVGAAEDARSSSEDEYRQVAAFKSQYPNLSVDWDSSYFLTPRCPAGKEKIAITCRGDVLGCSLTHISFGNVKQEPLMRIWQRASAFSQFKKAPDRCLAAFDRTYIEQFLPPIAEWDCSPIVYSDHPEITPASEPELFSRHSS